jgi:hypothetical protein
MAMQGDYLKDYTGIYTYTSGVANVGNLIYGELGLLPPGFSPAAFSPADKSVGAVIGNLWDGRYGAWAVHLREFTPALGQGDAISSVGPGDIGSDPNTHSSESFDVMWGKKFGTTSLGLRLNRSWVSAEGGLGYFDPGFGPTTNLEYDVILGGNPNLRRNILGLGGGLGFEVNPNTNAEVSLLWQQRTFETRDSTGTRTKDNGSATYMIAGRAMWQWQPNILIIPVIKFYSFDLSTVGPGVTAFDNSLKGWQAGAAGNWTLGTNDLFILGVTFAQNRIDQQTLVVGLPSGFLDSFDVTDGKITETIAPQVFAALETHVNNWLTVRFGANKPAYEQIKAESRVNGRTAKIQYSPFLMNIGAGVKLGTLQLDAVLNDSFPQTLGGFFSNTSDYVSFAKVSATYAF